MIAHLANMLSRPDSRRTRVGESREVALPAGTTRCEIATPSGRHIEFDTKDRAPGTPLRFDDTRVPGHYRVMAATSGPLEPVESESFVVDVDTRESNLSPASVDEAHALLGGHIASAPSSNATLLDRARSLGGFASKDGIVIALLFAMVAAFVVESVLGRSRA